MDIFSTKTWSGGVFGSYPYPLIIIINFGPLKSSILFTTSPLFNVKPQYRIIGYFGKYKIRKERGLVYRGRRSETTTLIVNSTYMPIS